MTATQISAPPHQQLYETDFIEWVNQAAELLQQGKLDALDIEHLIEEVEDLGRSQKQAFASNLRVVLSHLLKWQYQSGKRSGSWKGSIREHRAHLQDLIEDSPSLKNYYQEIIDRSYQKARETAADETGLSPKVFPQECPYTMQEALDDNFWPEG